MPSVIVIGAGGQLGSDLMSTAPDGRDLLAVDVIGVAHQRLDILDHHAVRDLLDRVRPDVVINTAAYVNVDHAEDEPDKAFDLNARAVRNLAQATDAIGGCLVHFSTDYVFDGRKRTPYTEQDLPAPLNVYGRSKLEGDNHVMTTCRRHLVVRSSGLYGVAGSTGKSGHGNFVSTMLRLGRERGRVSVVDDQVLTPTSTLDLAHLVWRLVDGDARGLFHATNSGQCSWSEFAREIFSLAKIPADVVPIDTATFGAKATRPAYSVLDNGKLAREGFAAMRPWRQALAEHLTLVAQLR